MEKTIEIDILTVNDLLERYNQKVVSKDLIAYIINSTPVFTKKDNLKIIVNNKTKIKCSELIFEGCKEEYNKNVMNYYRNNWLQLTYLLIGFTILILSTFIIDVVFKEIVLIGGWVFIWAMVEMEIFADRKARLIRRKLKKLLTSEIIEIKK